MAMIVHVQLFVDDHVIEGDATVVRGRLLDTLNGGASDYLRIEQVQVRPAGSSVNGPHVVTLPHALVAKQSILFAVIKGEQPGDRVPDDDIRVTKLPGTAFLTVPGYELRGSVHIPYSSFETTPEHYLARDADRFFALTEAEAIAVDGGPGVERDVADVVLVRTAAIEVFALDIPKHDWREE